MSRVLPAFKTHAVNTVWLWRRAVACWLWPSWNELPDRVMSLERQLALVLASNAALSADNERARDQLSKWGIHPATTTTKEMS